MIVIETLIGAISIIATWYMIYLTGIITERYILQEEEPEHTWIWPYVLRTLSGILGVAIAAGVVMCVAMCWAVGEAIMQSMVG
jgi:hypothetical protein